MDEAKKLDTQLQAKEVEVATAQQQLDGRKAKWETSRQRFAQQQEGAEMLGQQINKLREWKETRLNRQSVAENRTFIVTKLSDARKRLEAIEAASKNVIRYEGDINEKTAEHAQLTQRSQSLAKDVNEQNTQLETLQKDLSAIRVERLREESKALGLEVEDIRNAVIVWRQVYETLQAESTLMEKVTKSQKELTDNEAQLKAAAKALQAVTEQRKASASIVEKATLAASENVEALRAELVKGQACPVCGSEAHPYAHENPQLNHVLDELKKSHNE